MAHPRHDYPDAIAPDSRRHPEPLEIPGVQLPVPPEATPLSRLAAKDYGSATPPREAYGKWLFGTIACWGAFAVVLLVVSWLLYAIVWLFETILQYRPSVSAGIGVGVGQIVLVILVLTMVNSAVLG